jgi:hypothetical protein
VFAISFALFRSPTPFVRKASGVILREAYSALGPSDPTLYKQDDKESLDQLNECELANERAVPVNRKNNPKFKALTLSLLAGSDVMYTFAALRHHTIANEILPDEDLKKVALNRPELILTQQHRELKGKSRGFYISLSQARGDRTSNP